MIEDVRQNLRRNIEERRRGRTRVMSYYEPFSELPAETQDLNRVIDSLREELEAVNYYQQRATATSDGSVAAVMIHNRNEEIEHACMLIEWLRRNVPEFDKELRQYLFTDAPITDVEESATDGGQAAGSQKGGDSLGIGSLR